MGNNPADPAARIGYVALESRDYMKVGVGDGLASCSTVIDANVYAVALAIRKDLLRDRHRKSPKVLAFLARQAVQSDFMTPGGNQRMALRHGVGVREGKGIVVLRGDIAGPEPITEGTTAPRH